MPTPAVDPGIFKSLFERHERAILAFSGGKDSLALVHLLRGYRDRLELVWVNTGAMFPHMETFVREYGTRYKLTELHSDQAARFGTAGLPSRVVPVFCTPLMAALDPTEPDVLVNDWVSCCYALRTLPVVEHALENGIRLLFFGQRTQDGITFEHASDPSRLEVVAPLRDWTAAEVMDYLAEHRIELPEQYPRVMDSLECWNCTSYLSEPRFAYMRERYPHLLAELKPKIRAVYGAVMKEMAREWRAIQTALDGEPL